MSHKLASFNSMIHRAINVPLSNDNYNNEINIIKQIGHNNGYKPEIINRLVNKKQTKFLTKKYIYSGNNNIQPIKNLIYKKLLFTGDLSLKISRILPSHISPAFYTNSKIKNLINNKDVSNKFEKNGIYTLECNDCDAQYVGMTTRNFRTRIREHELCLRNNNYSEFANHLIETGHSFNKEKTKFKHININSYFNLCALETLEINKKIKSKINLVNKIIAPCKSPLLTMFPCNIDSSHYSPPPPKSPLPLPLPNNI